MKVGRWEKYLASIDSACIMDVDIYMDLACARYRSGIGNTKAELILTERGNLISNVISILADYLPTCHANRTPHEMVLLGDNGCLNISEAYFLEMSCKWASTKYLMGDYMAGVCISKKSTPFWYNGGDDTGIKPVHLLSLKGCPYFSPFFPTCLLHPVSRICLLLCCPCSVTHQNAWCLNSQEAIRKTMHIWVWFLFILFFWLG